MGPEDLAHPFHPWVPGNLSPYSPLVLAVLVGQEGPANPVVLEDQLAQVFPLDQLGLVFQEDLDILGYLLVLAMMTQLYYLVPPSYLGSQEVLEDPVNQENRDCLEIHVLPWFHCIQGYLEVQGLHHGLAFQEDQVSLEIQEVQEDL